jgi:hypothetical protein
MKKIISLAAISGFFIMTAAFAHAAAPEKPTPRALAITPTNPSIHRGLVLQFVATVTSSDGTSNDITTQATWTSSNTSGAMINNKGLASALAPGTTIITATWEGTSGTTILTVSSATLASISISPSNPSIPLKVGQQFKATGKYSDATTFDLTTQVAWSSSNASAATIASNGQATAVAPGNTTISATLGSISGSTSLAVTTATLSSISITPGNPSIPSTPQGVSEQLTATGTFSDGKTFALTTQVAWSSSNTSVATIASSGQATAVARGNTTISAPLGSISGSTLLTVTDATLSSITVIPAIAIIPIDGTQQFSALGRYSDGKTHDITMQVPWRSSNTPVATVNSSGLAKAYSAGAAKITANSEPISGNADLTVPPEQATSVTKSALQEGVDQALKLKELGFSESDIMEILYKNDQYKFGYAKLTPEQEAALGKSFSQDFIKNWIGVPQYVTVGASAIYLTRDNNMVGAGTLRIFFYPRHYFAEINNHPFSPMKKGEKVKWGNLWDNLNPDNERGWIHRFALNLGLTTTSATDTSKSANFFLAGLAYEINRSALLNAGWGFSTSTGSSGSRGQIYLGITLDSNFLKVIGVMNK